MIFGSWERVLVLAPHTDDGEFGCGGTMARLVDSGADVRYVAFSIATRSLPEGFAPDTLAREVREATAELGISEANLTVHDFDVRTFPERRQDLLEPLVHRRLDERDVGGRHGPRGAVDGDALAGAQGDVARGQPVGRAQREVAHGHVDHLAPRRVGMARDATRRDQDHGARHHPPVRTPHPGTIGLQGAP